MDPRRFETLVTALATSPSRRAALRILGSFGLGLLLDPVSALARDKGNDKGKGKGKDCKKGQKKCGKKCIAKTACCTNSDCNGCALEVCVNGTCGCAEGAERSFGVCGVDPQCKSSGFRIDFGDSASCCSGKSFYDPNSGQTGCLPGKNKCNVAIDCDSYFSANGIEACRGFMCPELYFSTLGVPCTPA